jgi:hypothetical protein
MELARLLNSDYYPFHEFYVSNQLDSQRILQLASLVDVPELHDALMPLGMIAKNDWLVLYILHNTDSRGYAGKIAIESFKPFAFCEPVREILLQWVVDNLPGSVHSFAWQCELNSRRTARHVVQVVLQGWDALDFTSFQDSLLLLLDQQENFEKLSQLLVLHNNPKVSLLRAIKCAMAAALASRRGVFRRLLLSTLSAVKAAVEVRTWCWCLSVGGNCGRDFTNVWHHLLQLEKGDLSQHARILLHDLMVNSALVADISANSLTSVTKHINTFRKNQLYPARWDKFCAKYHRVCRELCAEYRMPDQTEMFRQKARCMLYETDRWLFASTDTQGVVEVKSLVRLLAPYASDRVAINACFNSSVRFGISNPPIWTLMGLFLQVNEFITKTDRLFGHYRAERCWSCPVDWDLLAVYLRMVIHFFVYGKKLIVAPLLPTIDSTQNLEETLVKHIWLHQCPSNAPLGNSAQIIAREATAELSILVDKVGFAAIHQALAD